jgi:hypothetical protein
MADLNVSVPTGEISFAAATAKTALTMTAPTNQRLKLLGFEVYGKSASPTDTPCKCEFYRITTDGGTATTLTPAPNDDDEAETPQGVYKAAYTVEPTTLGLLLRTFEVHPQTGLIYMFPVGQELRVKGGKELGLRITCPAAQTFCVNFIVEE